MENYIVRIYRRNSSDPEQVNGVLESVEQETRRAFSSLDTLNSMLASGPEALPTKTAPSSSDAQPELALAK